MFAVLVILSLVVGLFAAGAPVARAVSPNIVISQVYGGGGNSGATYTHDFVELFNRGSSPVSLGGWSIQYASTTGAGNFGSSSTTLTELPNITLAPGQYLLIQEAQGSGGTTPLPTPDVVDPTPIAMSAAGGKVALISSAASLGCNGGSAPCSPAQLSLIVDLIGWGGANFYESSPAPATTNTTAAQRAGNGCTDTDNNSVDFATGAPNPRNTASTLSVCAGPTNPTGLGAASPTSLPAGGQSLLTVAVTPGANPPSTGLAVSVNLAPIGGSTTQPFFDDGANGDVTAGDNTFSYLATVAPGTAPGGKSLAAAIADAQARTGSSTIALTVEPSLVAIHDIQGAGHLSPLAGQLVATQGIVIARKNNGFWIQDPNPDAATATSKGIFVFTSAAPAANVGDAVKVTGTVKEFRPGGAGGTNNLTITELDNPGRVVTVLSSGNPLPAPTVIGALGRVPPNAIIEDDATGDVETTGVFDPDQDGIDFYESLEGMLVQVDDPVVVGGTNGFGEIFLVGDGGAGAGVRTPRGGIVVQPGDFNPERIQIDDVLVGLPNVKVGARLGTVVGVLDYSFSNFELLPVQAPTVVQNDLAQEFTAAAPAHQLRVATFNVENLAPADPSAKFGKLAYLVVNNLLAPDIIAVEEIQDNTGATNDGVVDANQTFGQLIAAIQAAGGPLYDYRQINPVDNEDGGAPGGNIRVGFLFRPDRVTFVDRPGGASTSPVSVVSGPTGPELSFSPGRIDPANVAFTDSRKPLAGEFLFRGDKVFVVANHFNSKGGDQPLFGRFQPPVLVSEAQRLLQAQVVNDFVDSILAVNPAANVVVAGDFNDFQFSMPLAALKGGVLANLLDTLPAGEQYTYVFEGNSQALDHTLVSAAVFGRPFTYDVVHANAEFPATDQASDHDPQVAALCVDAAPPTIQASVSPGLLWPPNHKLVRVNATVSAVDNADTAPAVTLVSVTSNEPDDGTGDGDTPQDIVIVNDTAFDLRAERAGGGAGRIYTITYQATDACGNVGTETATVAVSASQAGGSDKNMARAADAAAGGEEAISHAIFLPVITR
jgi:hypothetical protein